MKKIIYIFLILFCSVNAQNNLSKLDDTERIIIGKSIPENLNIGNSSKRILDNKLNRIITRHGIGSSDPSQRFIIFPSISVITKDITQTQPQMVAMNLEISLTIGDGITGDRYSSCNFILKGAGTNEEKAYISALKRISENSEEISLMFEESKVKIIEYYNTKCDFILDEALTKSKIKKYDESIYILSKIPYVCKECVEKANDTMVYVYKQKIQNECLENISKSKLYIAKDNFQEAADFLIGITPDVPCYSEAREVIKKIEDHKCSLSLSKAESAWAVRDLSKTSEYISEISADSECYYDAKELQKNIIKKLNADEKRKWDLEYEKYNRNQKIKESMVANDIELKNRDQSLKETNNKHQIDMDNREITYKENQGFQLEKSRISAAREISVAYAKNQKKITYNVSKW
tara:strand:+ start:2611 stop:3828 length:1218 start_codon:yes stop_codon:yes gene_type:complete